MTPEVMLRMNVETRFLDLCDSFILVATGESTQVEVFMIVGQTFLSGC